MAGLFSVELPKSMFLYGHGSIPPELDNMLKKKLKKVTTIEDPPTKLIISIATIRTGCRLDLNRMARNAVNVEERLSPFTCLIMRLRRPRVAARIFASGKIICTGATTELDARRACRRICRILQKVNSSVNPKGFEIQNVVASSNTGGPMDLQKVFKMYRKYCSYEPELFPALIFRPVRHSNISVNIFRSASVTIAGAKSETEVTEGWSIMEKLLKDLLPPRLL